MERHFLRSYMQHVVQVCHRHGAQATGGMAPAVLPPGTQGPELREKLVEAVKT